MMMRSPALSHPTILLAPVSSVLIMIPLSIISLVVCCGEVLPEPLLPALVLLEQHAVLCCGISTSRVQIYQSCFRRHRHKFRFIELLILYYSSLLLPL